MGLFSKLFAGGAPKFDFGSYVDGLRTEQITVATHYDQAALQTTMKHLPDMLNARIVVPADDGSSVSKADVVMFWGLRMTSKRASSLKSQAEAAGKPKMHAEDGFLRSRGIGLSGDPSLSVIIDDRTPYYDGTSPSRLESELNSAVAYSAGEIDRADALISGIKEHRLSKYNHAPDKALEKLPGRSVLVVDQREGDFSVSHGLADAGSFSRMFDDALKLSQDTNIIVKIHPDATTGGKGSYLLHPATRAAQTDKRVTIVDYEINPHALFDAVDEVWVVTSGMGFEACMRGLPVTCYGAPYYSGWGFTTDKVTPLRRLCSRTVQEVFHAAWIRFSRYYDPVSGRRGTIEDVISYLATPTG